MNTNSKNDGAAAVLAEAAHAAVHSVNGRAKALTNGTPNGHANGKKNGKVNGASANGTARVALITSSAPPTDITSRMMTLEPCLRQVEDEIERMISTPVKLIADIAAHTLGAGGKRLRPALTVLSAQICGDDAENPSPRVVKSAGAVELIHTTTLLHDDVVDDALVRRGKPAANLVWGNETSVLVGDFLFAQVFVNAAKEGFGGLLLPIATATAEMCAGELMETQMRGNLSMSEEQYFEIIALKTAALTDCACRLGALAVEAPADDVERLGRYGHAIGMAFQIVDDVFDIASTQGRIGKPVGNDIREGDITLPMLRAMSVCEASECAELQAVIGQTPLTDEGVARALEIIRGCDAVDYALGKAQEFVILAKEQVQHFEPCAAREMLEVIADYVVSREK